MNKNEDRDLKILADAFYSELFFGDGCEYGAPMLDCKRPFGNSDVEGDICELLEMEPEGDEDGPEYFSRRQRDYARLLYTEKLIPYLRSKWAEQSKDYDKNSDYSPE